MTEDVNGTPLIVDSDAHVVESDRTWDYLEPSEKQYRPVQLASPEQDGVSLQFWLVDGKVRGLRLPAFSEEELERLQRQVGRRFAEPKESNELGNVGLRLEYMDANKVDVQVLHNTMFIEKVTERPPVEVALCGSWNRWLADIWSQSDGTAAVVVPRADPEHVGRSGPDPFLQGARRLRGADATGGGQPAAGGPVLLPHL